MRPIDSDDFLKQSTELYEHAGWDEREVHFSLADLRCNLEMMPTVEAEPVRHGHWIEHPFSAVFEKVHSKDQIVCSCCEEAFNAFFNETERFKYCPNCGAKMDEGKEE